jgi:hypothetical protein
MVRDGRSWNGVLSLPIAPSSGTLSTWGSSDSTGLGSIFSDRHTDCASARVKVALGSWS